MAHGLTSAQVRSLLRQDFEAFAKMAFAELNPAQILLMAPYIRLMMAKLEDCRAGRIRRLIICLPPRGLKSHVISVAFVAWLLGHDPTKQVICVSHGQDLADKLARDCRRIMLAIWYQNLFATRLDRTALNDFSTTAGGLRMATSVGGQLTGRGADFIVIDDPLKAEQAFSETERNGVNHWHDNTLLSRLNNQKTGCIIIVMQRLHEDDLVGHVLSKADGDGWTKLFLPAIAEEDERIVYETPLGRQVYRREKGQVLHPERESLAELINRKRGIDSYTWASQYQQTPIPIGGNMVKPEWLRRYEPSELPERPVLVIQSWDTATKTEHLNDYSVCTTWWLVDDSYYLIDVYRAKLEYPDLRRKAMELAERYQPDDILIEDKSSGSALIQDLRRESLPVREYKPPPSTDKAMRLHAQTGKIEAGRIRLPLEASWLDTYVNELIGFPGTRHDDQVDSTTQMLDYLGGIGSDLAIWCRLGEMY